MKKTERDALRTAQLGAYADRMAAWLRDVAATSDAPVLLVLELILDRARIRVRQRTPSACRMIWEEEELRGLLPAISWSEFVAASEVLGGLWLDKKVGGRSSGSVFGCWLSYGDETRPARLETYLLGPLDPSYWMHLAEADRLGALGTETNRELAMMMHARLVDGLQVPR